MSVDLPEPEGPMTATSSPRSTASDDAVERGHGRLALAVAADEAPRHHRGPRRGGVGPMGGVPGDHRCSGHFGGLLDEGDAMGRRSHRLPSPPSPALPIRPPRGDDPRGGPCPPRAPPASSQRMTRTARTADARRSRARYGRPVRIRAFIDSWLVDVIVVVLFVFAEGESWFSSLEGRQAVLSIGAAFWTLPLLARRRFPFGAPVTVLVALAAEALLANNAITQSGISFVTCMLAVGLIGAQGFTRRGLAGGALALAVIGTVVAVDPEGGLTDFLIIGGVAGFSWIVGLSIHERTRRTAELEERAARLERERDAEARTAVAEERARIARELHDVVAHSLSVMVVQAEAAERHARPRPGAGARGAGGGRGRPAARPSRAAPPARRAARRPDDAPALDAAAGPRRARRAGRAGPRRRAARRAARSRASRARCRSGVDLSAYRIVQEALTNALKHAGPARAEVHRRATATDDLELEVERRRPRRTATARHGGGHGLVGMRERVALYGGELEAGPRRAAAIGRARPPAAGEAGGMRSASCSPTTRRWSAPASAMILDAQPDIDVVGEAADGARGGRAGRDAHARRRPDGHPHARARRHRGHPPAPADGATATRVLMLTTFDLDEYVYAALRAGASGFLLKDVPPRASSSPPSASSPRATRCSRRRSPAG